jgi:parallel beta-helix repeat protein
MIYLADGSNCDMVNMATGGNALEGMTVRDLYFDGNNAENSGTTYIIDCQNTFGARVIRCFVFNAASRGIGIGNTQNITIDNCRIRSCASRGIASSSSLTGPTWPIITNNHIYSNVGEGIYLYYPSKAGGITGNQIYNNSGRGIYVYAGSSSANRELTINGNYLKYNGSTGNVAGIEVAMAGGAAMDGITITGNQVNGSYGTGILIQGTATASEIRGLSITGNFIWDNGFGGAGGRGIHVYSNVHHGAITGNTVKNNDGAGIFLQGDGSDGKVTFIAVMGNDCTDDQGSPTQDYGIQFGSNSENCCAIGNPVDGNVTAEISDSGTDNDIAHNPGY